MKKLSKRIGITFEIVGTKELLISRGRLVLPYEIARAPRYLLLPRRMPGPVYL